MEPMESIRLVLSARMREARKVLKINQDGLAERSRLSVDMIKKVEAGDRWPSPETLEAIAMGLGVTISALLTEPQEGNVVTIHGAIKKFLKIPEDIIERAQAHEVAGEVWEFVRIAFDEVEEHRGKTPPPAKKGQAKPG